MDINTYMIGSIVTINSEFLGDPPGTKCFVYEHYNIGGNHPGISLITEHGKDLGGFNVAEQAEYLQYWNDTGMTYRFHNVMELARDFRAGVFTKYFTLPKREVSTDGRK